MALFHPRRRATPRIGLPLALAVFVAVAFALAAAVVAWQDAAFAAPGALLAMPASLAANVIPAAITALLLLALSRRPLFSLVVAAGALYLLYYVNAKKLELLATPLLPADFTLLGHLGDGGALLSHYVGRRVMALFVLVLGGLVLLAVRERPWTRLRGPARAALLAGVLVIGASLAGRSSLWNSVYAAEGTTYNAWSPAESVRQGGLPATLLRYAWSTAFVLPQPDRALAARFMQTHAEDTPAPAAPSDAEQPDIVILQSESFFDPARLRGFEPAQALPEFRRIAATSRHGDLWVPTFGGGTIRTEFEVLTGLAMRYFPSVPYPYLRLTAQPLPSLASVLAARGYRTIALHPHVRTFWNRAAALSHMGFAEFDGIEEFDGAPRVGYYVSDDALVDHMLRHLDAAKEPLFLFAISMENHGPYDSYPNADPARIAEQPVPAALDANAAADLRGYLFHVADADRALGKLVDALRKRPRRTLLLFYGDHLPTMPETYAQAGFDDAADGTEQPVPWLLFDSAHPDAPAAPESTASFYLPALLLDAAGIDDHGWFAALESARRQDHPGPHWVPADDDELAAAALMRQRGELH